MTGARIDHGDEPSGVVGQVTAQDFLLAREQRGARRNQQNEVGVFGHAVDGFKVELTQFEVSLQECVPELGQAPVGIGVVEAHFIVAGDEIQGLRFFGGHVEQSRGEGLFPPKALPLAVARLIDFIGKHDTLAIFRGENDEILLLDAELAGDKLRLPALLVDVYEFDLEATARLGSGGVFVLAEKAPHIAVELIVFVEAVVGSDGDDDPHRRLQVLQVGKRFGGE